MFEKRLETRYEGSQCANVLNMPLPFVVVDSWKEKKKQDQSWNFPHHILRLYRKMFDDSNPPSPSRGTSAMSPLIKDAVKDIDWNSPQTLPTPTKPDPRESPWLALSLIVPGLYLTCERTTEERMRLVVMGCRLVVKMNADVDEAPFNIYAYDDDAATQVMKAVDEETFIKRLVAECTTLDSDRALLMEPLFIRSVVADDSPVFDIAAYFEELCSLIELVLSRRKLLETEYSDAAKSGADVRLPNVVVHCKAGVSRSAAIVIAYMMKKYHISRAHALQYVQDARPVASPNHGFVAQLTLWESTRGHRVTDELSAALVADSIMRGNTHTQIAGLLTDQLKVLSTSSRLFSDRETFGRLVGQLVDRKLNMATVVNCLDKVLLDGIHDQAYIDTPTFVHNIVQITTSIKTFAPQIVATGLWATGDDDDEEEDDREAVVAGTDREGSAAEEEAVPPLESSSSVSDATTTIHGVGGATQTYSSPGGVLLGSATLVPAAPLVPPPRPPRWISDDAIHRRWIQAFCTAASDASEAVEAMCKYIHALSTTQLPAGVANVLPVSLYSQQLECSDTSFGANPGASTTTPPVASPTLSNVIVSETWIVPPSPKPRPVLLMESTVQHAATSPKPMRDTFTDRTHVLDFRQDTQPPPASPIEVPWATALTPPLHPIEAPLPHQSSSVQAALRVPDSIHVVFSFPIISSFAQFAVGFIPWAQLDEAVPSAVSSAGEARDAVKRLRALSRRWFLVARWDGAVGAVGMNKLKRWTSCTADPTAPSYLQALGDDIEVDVLEAMEQLEDALNAIPPPSSPLPPPHCEEEKQQEESPFMNGDGDGLLKRIQEEVVGPIWTAAQHTLLSADLDVPRVAGYGDGGTSARAAITEMIREKIASAVVAFVDMHRSELDYIQRTISLLPRGGNGSPLAAAGRRSTSVEGSSSLSDSIGAMPPPVQYVRENSGSRLSFSVSSSGELDDARLLGADSWQLWLQERRQLLKSDVLSMLGPAS